MSIHANQPSIESLQREIEMLKGKVAALESEKNLALTKMHAGSLYQKSQSRFRTIFENSPFGNKIIKADFIIMQANKAVSTLLGYSNDEIVGTRILDYVPEEHQKEWKELQKNLWERHIPVFSLESCLLKKDGTLVCCEITSILFVNQSDLLGYTILEDTTDQMTANKQKDEFIGKVSHELKTPVTSIKAFSQIIMRSLASKGNPVDTMYLQRMISQISLLEVLMKDLFDVTRADSGKLILNRDHFDLNEHLDDLVKNLQVINSQHRLNIVENSKTTVFADESRITQVMTNLINNAVKYSPEADVIDISLRTLEDNVVFCVRDFGIGIPKQQVGEIFNKFHQVEGSSGNAGLGLGLYISKEIILKEGGTMWLESIEGCGSSFYFSIPVA